MSFDTYTERAQAIFDRFPNEQVWFQGGLRPNRQLQSPEAGYCIVMRYDEITTRVISQFMTKISSVLPPMLVYLEKNYHSTVGTFGKRDMAGFIPEPEILQPLARSVENGLANRSQNLRIDFGKWLYNDESILVSCSLNEDLWQLFQNVGTACQENGYPLEMARVTHITTARFTGSVSQSEFEQFACLMNTAPVIAAAKPYAVDLAAWHCDGLTFELDVYKRHSL
jgi:hypothetical protein